MAGFLSSLTFLNPWILSGLIFLPALWFLLRVVPPAPKHIYFPATRFLAGLKPESRTSSTTPWWILLLRLLTVALLIIALARPVMNPGEALPGRGPVRIVLDNGWESAQNWKSQIEEAQNIIDRAGREKRTLYIATTAPEPGKEEPLHLGPFPAGDAEAALRGLEPYPWPSDYDSAEKLVLAQKSKDSIFSFWLSAGLGGKNQQALLRSLQNKGGLHFTSPAKDKLPVLLSSINGVAQGIKIRLSLPEAYSKNRQVLIQTIGNNGGLLDAQQATLPSGKTETEVTLEIPDTLRNRMSRINIAGQTGAGGVIILDDQNKRRVVGIAATKGEAESSPLIDDSYYLIRALDPYASLLIDTLPALLEKTPSVIILPDISALTSQELNELESWVRKGGLLLRFAGPNMTQGESFLTPVPLRKGGRALDGALTWAEPVKLAPFPENSPLYGLPVQEEITVKRQMLAEPVADIKEKTWAALSDGTPLITADSLDNGLLVLVHTTASPDWSNLALSGLYVQLLRRIINLSPGRVQQTSQSGTLQPLLVLNGIGEPGQPKSFVKPIDTAQFANMIPSQYHPPGLYGQNGYEQAFNLGNRIKKLQAISAMPAGVNRHVYEGQQETDLMPPLLLLAFCLFLFDWAVMLIMQFSHRFIFSYNPLKTGFVILAVLSLSLLSPQASAQDKMTEEMRYANDLYLAYITTPLPDVNRTVQKGLESLSKVLTRRTSVEPAGVVALNPEKDELAFFPFIYWPVTSGDKALSDKALEKVQYYLNHGGTILFDTRDRFSAPQYTAGMTGGDNQAALRRIIGTLDIPPLAPMPQDHVLGKSFYLLSDLPGYYRNGTIWVKEKSGTGNGVSPVIIGSHDWAKAWALSGQRNPPLSGGPRQQELSLRAGVNIVMYALTGNYKSDQVHLPHILERLGQ